MLVTLTGAGCADDPKTAAKPAAEPTPEPELPPYGAEECERFGQVDLHGQYMLQNGLWNDDAVGQTQCVTALWDGSSAIAGFVVDPVAIDMPGGAPASYPSIVYGWHWGRFYGAYQQPKHVADVASIPSSWRFSVPEDARFDAMYDLWLHSKPSPPDADGSLEIMIWVASRDAEPIGELVELATIGDAEWEVWYGPNSGFNSLTYRRTESVYDLDIDLRPLVEDAVVRGYLAPDWYLLSVEAGFEIYRASQALVSQRYRAEIQ